MQTGVQESDSPVKKLSRPIRESSADDQPTRKEQVAKDGGGPAVQATKDKIQESDDDCNFSSDESGEEEGSRFELRLDPSDESGEDSEEEHRHFELRLDPAEDVCDENAENIAPAKKKARRLPSRQPLSWKTESDGDAAPPTLRFLPKRKPGVQLSTGDSHTPLDLFKLFFSEEAVETLCRNTNKQAARNAAGGAKYKWLDVGVSEFYSYIGLIFYMATIKRDHITDYWRKNSIFSIPFPSQVMSRDRYRTISWNVHMSDPDEDRANDAKRGTSEHDRLFRVKPLMCTIQTACKAFYHPRRSLAVGERMVPCKGYADMTEHTTDKPTKLGFKLFVLADSSNGYTVDFSVYSGRKKFPTGQGLSYDSVMSLVDRRYLGSGYHVYTDSFYTSPKLFRDLFACKFGACGAYRESRRDCPRSSVNALTEKSPRGTYRWIRDGPLLFVKWMDTREVSVCSTIHTAYAGDAVRRKVKCKQGVWTTKSFPCPSPVVEYNKLMGGVDLSEQLIQYHAAQHKTLKWYRKLFLHFLDIAATNAYILHKELQQQDSMTPKAFMEELTAQLCGVTQKRQKTPVKKASCVHVPVPGAEVVADSRTRASAGRRTCAYCRGERGKNTKTPWKCKACDVYLCLQPDRNCFEAWHPDQD
ncbi:piggyBac transposable element-derived protein 4-like [Chanos chanos]|uniref:PiggyBac transposable element-derived protein 4-like n=1 Tax=Chanos chanos TaxID=29144 RepID=A0A6J2W735_CHACN|nr:piggyBac transposable element-derived protein 4-like [Chanos chanos]